MSKLNAPVALIIMDGWGVGDAQSTTNAVNVGKTPVIDGLTAKYPHAQLACSGEAVGLPDGQAIFSILLTFTMESFILGSVVICCLGVLMYLLNTPTQMYYLQVSKKFYPGTLALAGSLTSSSYNVGIAVGSFAGSLSVDLAGLNSVGITGGVFAILATIISYLLASRIKREYKEVIARAMRMLNK